jgi:DNA-binding response OmpR family regulator
MLVHHPTSTACDPALGCQILVVEDNIDAANLLRRALKFNGHRVCIATDGNSAIEALMREKPEVVLLDIGLPGIDGFEVARRIRSTPSLRDILIIATTALDSAMDRRRSDYVGIDFYLIKPVNLEVVEDLIHTRLKSSEPVLH